MAKDGDRDAEIRECDWGISRCRCIPLHRSWAETLKEDREAIILADKLGFYDAFMGEHLTDKAENITNSMMFNATLISDTKKIKLAHRHHQPVAHAPGADRPAGRDVRPSVGRPLHLRA